MTWAWITCGLLPGGKYFFEDRPPDPEMRDSVSFRIFDVALADFPVFQQANVLYNWDGVQAYGMIERVAPQREVGLT